MDLSQEIDTVVVPAKEINYEKIFLGEHQWHGIQINTKILSKLKYIAIYRSSPISALTHWAKITSIENSNSEMKFIIKFEPPVEVKPIPNIKHKGKVGIIIGPRYTNMNLIKKVSYFVELFIP